MVSLADEGACPPLGDQADRPAGTLALNGPDPCKSPAPGSRTSRVKPSDLRGILEYVPMFRDHVFVIAMDGSVIEHENFANIIADIAVLRSLNIKVVLAHGIGEQLRQRAAASGLQPSDVYGEGVTDAPTLALARETAGLVTQTLVEALSREGLRTAVTNYLRATEKGIIEGVPQQFTGRVERPDAALLKSLLDQSVIPLFPPLLCDRDGRPLRVNSDLLAAETAIALGASKLIFLTTASSLFENGSTPLNMPREQLDAILADRRRAGLIVERLRSKASHAVRALSNGVARVHILDGRLPDGLLTEIFDKMGIGTMIYAKNYDGIRVARKKDAQVIYDITKQGVRNQTLVQRTRAYIEQHVQEYFVYEVDGSVIGCARLRPCPGQPCMELGSVYVQPFYQGRGVGRRLVEYAELHAASVGVTRLLLLTTQNHNFFHNICGFEDATPEDLPPERRAELNQSRRNSRILCKDLRPVAHSAAKTAAGGASTPFSAPAA